MEHVSDIPLPNLDDETLSDAVIDAVESETNGTKPDALFILSAGIRKSTVSDEWHSVEWGHPGDLGLHTGGRTRVLAAVQVAEVFDDMHLVTTSYNRNSADEPTMASVATKELVSRGIPEQRIVPEEESFSTITQYIELLKLAKQYDWKTVAVMGNEYYHPRLEALFNNLPGIVKDSEVESLWNEFIDDGRTFVVMDCEPILRAKSPHYAEYLNEVYKQPYYHEMVQKEAQGVQAIERGEYVYKLTPNVERNSYTVASE